MKNYYQIDLSEDMASSLDKLCDIVHSRHNNKLIVFIGENVFYFHRQSMLFDTDVSFNRVGIINDLIDDTGLIRAIVVDEHRKFIAKESVIGVSHLPMRCEHFKLCGFSDHLVILLPDWRLYIFDSEMSQVTLSRDLFRALANRILFDHHGTFTICNMISKINRSAQTNPFSDNLESIEFKIFDRVTFARCPSFIHTEGTHFIRLQTETNTPKGAKTKKLEITRNRYRYFDTDTTVEPIWRVGMEFMPEGFGFGDTFGCSSVGNSLFSHTPFYPAVGEIEMVAESDRIIDC